MIFQAGINLDIEDKDVEAVIDLETGLIGFTEKVGDKTEEFYYTKSPIEFRVAFLNKIESLCVSNSHMNFKICIKEELSSVVHNFIFEKGDS